MRSREIEILKALRVLYFKFLARDKDGELFAHYSKPEKYKTDWYDGGKITGLGQEDLFTFIKWEDEEPTNIDEVIEELENDTSTL